MKKLMVLLVASLVLSLLAFPLVASGTNESGDDKVYELSIGSISGPSHLHNVVLREWVELVKEETNGRLVLTVFDSAQLGGEREYIEGMKLGTVDMCQTSTGPISGFIPQFMVAALPYVFQGFDQIEETLTGKLGQKLFGLLEDEGIKGLAWFTNGFRSVFNTERPIYVPEDLKGLKIRVMESPLMVSTLNAMGASATPMAYSELYTAIHQGVMDGAENAPGNVLNDKFFEVCSYYSLTEHFAPPGVVAISLSVFNKLPEDLQEYLVEAGKKLQKMEMSQDREAQGKFLEDLKASGMKVNTVDKAAFTEAVAPVLEKFSAEIGSEIMDLIN
ncbi:MAG: TRAP transporter substrate-binding protein [Bacteroidetes bacterium]|nr:TRAP transporter substrate-binding protein [Bacteroidota bacterium]